MDRIVLVNQQAGHTVLNDLIRPLASAGDEWFSGSTGGALLLTVVMIVLGFLFSAVAGYLVGLIGSSNNPISGLTLSALLISAILMVWIGVTGIGGVAAVLAIAGVVCCAAGVAGDMMQDLKVGHLLGGTPWRMEISEIIGVIVAASVLTLPLKWMDAAICGCRG